MMCDSLRSRTQANGDRPDICSFIQRNYTYRFHYHCSLDSLITFAHTGLCPRICSRSFPEEASVLMLEQMTLKMTENSLMMDIKVSP